MGTRRGRRLTLQQARETKTPVWTQQDLEGRSGVRQSVISRIESGEIVQPRPDTLRSLARALGMEAVITADGGLLFEER